MSAVLISSMNEEEIDQYIERVASSPNERIHLLQRLLGDTACRQLGLRVYPQSFTLSVVIPVYNERQWVRETGPARAGRCRCRRRSSSWTTAAPTARATSLRELEGEGLRVVLHDVNQGKGAALRTGFQHARATWSWCRTPTSNTIRPSIRG